jgi:hypothetical protein
MPVVLVLLGLLLGLACARGADSQLSTAPTERIDEALHYFVGTDLIAAVRRTRWVEVQDREPSIPKQLC